MEFRPKIRLFGENSGFGFIGCRSEGLDKTGEGQAECVAKALQQHPWIFL